jgi:hypothetical protein
VVDPRTGEAWSRLLGSMRASAEMIDELLPFAPGLNREQLASLLGRASGQGAGSGRRPPGMESIEQFWGLLGLVPRYRYDELDERHQALRARLEEAEVTIQRLRKLMDERGREPEARELLDSWATAVRDTLDLQADIMRSMTGLAGTKEATAPREPRGGTGSSRRQRPRRAPSEG